MTRITTQGRKQGNTFKDFHGFFTVVCFYYVEVSK